MGQNSIRNNLRKEDIIADIKMTLAADFKHEKNIVVVEGNDDISFFNGKFSNDVYLYESFSGKCGVIEIVEFFTDNRVIGICDKDYDHIQENLNLFYYDFCCLEMMLIANDQAFDTFFYEFYKGTASPTETRNHILHDLLWLSTFRKLSVEKGWGIIFNGLSIAKAYNDRKGNLDLANLISQLNKINYGFTEKGRSLLTQVSTACKTNCDTVIYFNITQGHDFLHYFQRICQNLKNRKGKSFSVENISSGLRCSYRMVDFQSTKLYQSLLRYQNTYQRNLLLE